MGVSTLPCEVSLLTEFFFHSNTQRTEWNRKLHKPLLETFQTLSAANKTTFYFSQFCDSMCEEGKIKLQCLHGYISFYKSF